MTINYEQLLDRLTNLRALALPPSAQEHSGCFSSYDRRSRYDAQQKRYIDWDANDDGNGAIRTLEDGTVIAAEAEGPGVIWRSWSAMPGNGAIRIWVDGECIIDRPFIEYFTHFGGDFAPANHTSLCPHISRGYNSFLPIPFNRSLRIELAPGWGAYYHFTYTTFGPDVQLPNWNEMFSIRGRRLLAALDRHLYRRGEDALDGLFLNAFATEPGCETVLLEQTGAGAVQKLVLRLDRPEIADSLTLRMYWDGEDMPSVCAPVSDFFATTPTSGMFRTWVCGKVGGVLYARWYMPYANGARITLTNETESCATLQAGFQIESCADAAQLMRFCALSHDDLPQWKNDPIFRPGGERWPDWLVLRTQSSGRFCGMHLLVDDTYSYPEGRKGDDWWFGFSGEPRLDWWWGEGDEKFFVDGEHFPSTFGTGSEDYFGYAWAADPPFAFFDSPFAAMSDMPLDGNGITSVCRFHICDNIPFHTSFEAYMEKYKGNSWGNGNVCRYRVTPYWYRTIK